MPSSNNEVCCSSSSVRPSTRYSAYSCLMVERGCIRRVGEIAGVGEQHKPSASRCPGAPSIATCPAVIAASVKNTVGRFSGGSPWAGRFHWWAAAIAATPRKEAARNANWIWLAGHSELVARSDALGRCAQAPPVDGDLAVGDQLLHVAPRADARLRQHFVQLGRVGSAARRVCQARCRAPARARCHRRRTRRRGTARRRRPASIRVQRLRRPRPARLPHRHRRQRHRRLRSGVPPRRAARARRDCGGGAGDRDASTLLVASGGRRNRSPGSWRQASRLRRRISRLAGSSPSLGLWLRGAR